MAHWVSASATVIDNGGLVNQGIEMRSSSRASVAAARKRSIGSCEPRA
jgi:hypothetical protein